MRSVVFGALAAGFVSLAPGQASAQAVDLSDTTSRMVSVAIQGDTPGAFGPELPAMLTFDGDTARITISPEDAPAGAPAFNPIALQGAMVTFTGGMFTMQTARTIEIDVPSGNARVMQMSEGMITFNISFAGLMLMEPVQFGVRTLAASDLGPVFSGDTIPDPNAPDVTSGEPLRINGSGRACAMDPSGFLVPEIGAATCTPETFENLVQLDPKPFDADSGELTAVGFTQVSLVPFTVAGAVMVQIQPIQNASLTTVRISEIR